MTEQQYHELLTWCRSSFNKGTPEYAARYDLKQQAIEIRRNIQFCRSQIKRLMFYYEKAKDESVIERLKGMIDEQKEAKTELMKKFDKLKYI